MNALDQQVIHKSRVLLVDDHAVVRKGMTAMINEEPDMVVCGEADGVRSALDAVAQCSPDVALVDLSIKDGDGLELIKEIRRRWKDVAVLVLSMYDASVYADRALRAGARGYIMKAQAARTVMDGIRSVLRGETYFSDPKQENLAENFGDAPAADRSNLLATLTDREMQVLRCIGKGWSGQEIADELFISPKTVEAHREHIKHKLELASSGDLLRYAIEHNRIHD